MTWLEFFASIIDSIFSWPVALLLAVLILRKQLAELLRSVESLVLEAGGTRVSFNRNLERAKESIAEASKAQLPAADRGIEAFEIDSYLIEQTQFISELARTEPSFAIDQAWERLIADQARRLAHARGIPPSDDTQRQLRELSSRGIVSPDIYDSARYLNKIRVEVGIAKMHPTTTQALEYLQTAEEVALYLNSLLNTPSQEYPQ